MCDPSLRTAQPTVSVQTYSLRIHAVSPGAAPHDENTLAAIIDLDPQISAGLLPHARGLSTLRASSRSNAARTCTCVKSRQRTEAARRVRLIEVHTI